MKRILKRTLVYVGAAALFVGILFGAELYESNARSKQVQVRREEAIKNSDTESRSKRVKIWEVFPLSMIDVLKLPGTVEANEHINLAVRTGGNVEWIGPEEGDAVTTGAKVLQLDVKDIQTQVEQAQAQFELARQKFERIQKLRAEGVVSVDQYDSARAELKTRQAALEATRVNLDYGTVRAPIAGFVDRVPVDVGEHVQKGQTVIDLVDIDRIKVTFNVPEKDVLYFKPGDSARITFTNGESLEFTGLIDFVAMTANPRTRTYRTKILVANPEHTLRPGMIVRGHLVRRQVDETIAVPFFTILSRENGHMVYVVDDKGKAQRRLIEYGIIEGGLVQIKKGLNAGDRLIVVGHRELSDGQPVEVAADLTEMARQHLNSGADIMDLARKAQLGRQVVGENPFSGEALKTGP